MTIRKFRSQRGISLLEVMIAMIILSMALVLLLNMSMIALDGNDWSNGTTRTTQAIQEKMEQLRGGEKLASGSDTTPDGYKRTWVVTSEAKFLRRVDVSIVWENVRNDTLTNTMTSYIVTDSV